MLLVDGLVIRGEMVDTTREDIAGVLVQNDSTPVDAIVLEQVTVEGPGGTHSVPVMAIAKAQISAYGPIAEDSAPRVNPVDSLKLWQELMTHRSRRSRGG